MTTLEDVKLNCPYCNKSFRSTTLGSTNTFGPLTTDFYRKAAGTPPLPFFIHTCPKCAYSGGLDDFDDVILDKKTKNLIFERLAPLVKDEEPFPGRRYEYAAWIAKWRSLPSLTVGNFYLRAAWCCYDDDLKDEEFYYRKQAIEHFEIAYNNNEIQAKEKAVYCYLIGELYRRIDEKLDSDVWFDRVAELVSDDPQDQRFVQLSQQQKTNPKEFISE